MPLELTAVSRRSDSQPHPPPPPKKKERNALKSGVRSAMRASSQLPGAATDVDNGPVPTR